MAKKSKKTTETGLSTVVYTQDDVKTMLDQVTKTIANIKGGSGEIENTKGVSFGEYGEIRSISSLENLIRAHSALSNRRDLYTVSGKLLAGKGMKFPPFKIDGHTFDQWEKDIKAQYITVAQKDKLAALEKMQKALSERLSEEQKLSNTMGEMADLMATFQD